MVCFFEPLCMLCGELLFIVFFYWISCNAEHVLYIICNCVIYLESRSKLFYSSSSLLSSRFKRLVFRRFLNIVSDGADVTSWGKVFLGGVFHSREAATGKADGWKTGALDNKRWWRSGAETLAGLDIRRLVMFLSEVPLPASCLYHSADWFGKISRRRCKTKVTDLDICAKRQKVQLSINKRVNYENKK